MNSTQLLKTSSESFEFEGVIKSFKYNSVKINKLFLKSSSFFVLLIK